MVRPPAKKPKPSPKVEQTLAVAVADAPRLMDRRGAQARVDEWLSEIGRSADGKALKRLLAAAPKVEALLTGLSDGSPYLWDLVEGEPARLLALLESDPDRHLAELLAGTEKAVALMKKQHWDEPLLDELARAMVDASICGLGQAAPNPFASVIRYFPEELK